MSPHLTFPILSKGAPIEQPPEASDVGVFCNAALSSQPPTHALSVSQQVLWVYLPPYSWLPLLFHSHSPVSDPCLSPRLVQKPPICLPPTILAPALQFFKLPGCCLSNTSKNPTVIPSLYAKLSPKSSVCNSYNLTPQYITHFSNMPCTLFKPFAKLGMPFSQSHIAIPWHFLHVAISPLWLLLGAYLTHGRCLVNIWCKNKTSLEMRLLQSCYLLHSLDCFTL